MANERDGDAGAFRPVPRRREALVRFDDADALAVFAEVFEPDRARDPGKERVVLSETDVLAWMDACAALAHDDGARRDELAGKALYAQPLAVRVATVLGTAYTFFVSHFEFLPRSR